MSPRPYRLGRRQPAIQQTRARVVVAARELLAGGGDPAVFSIDAVARRAGVARMTVYYQFDSRRGLLEALFDDLAADGGMGQLAAAFKQADPLDALAGFVAAFCRFWATDRLLLRRLRALAVLDLELGQAHQDRNERRRQGLRVIVRRLAERRGRPPPQSAGEAVDLLYALTSFETFDALAGPARNAEEVATLITRLAGAALDLDGR